MDLRRGMASYRFDLTANAALTSAEAVNKRRAVRPLWLQHPNPPTHDGQASQATARLAAKIIGMFFGERPVPNHHPLGRGHEIPRAGPYPQVRWYSTPLASTSNIFSGRGPGAPGKIPLRYSP